MTERAVIAGQIVALVVFLTCVIALRPVIEQGLNFIDPPNEGQLLK